MKFLHLSLLLLISGITFGQAGGLTCAEAEPICSDAGVTFTANSGTPSASDLDPGNNYGCLLSTPNPAWYFLEIDNPGDIIMSLSAPTDIDFIIWGPYPDLATAQGMCGSHSNIVPDMNCSGFLFPTCDAYGCSFDITANETPGIPNAQTGEVYVMLVTNYANNVQDITLVQTGGSGSTNCEILTNCSLQVDAGANTSLCVGETLNLNGSFQNEEGNTTITWTANPAGAINDLSNTNTLNPVFSPSQAYGGSVTLTLTVEDDGPDFDCEISDQITISLADPSPATVTSNGTICEGDNAIFTINGAPGQTVTYTLDGGATSQTVVLNSSGQGVVTVTSPTSDQTITLTEVSDGPCSNTLNVSANVTIDLSGSQNVSIDTVGVLCQSDENVTLVGTPPGGTWLINGDPSNGIFSPSNLAPGNYTITYNPPGACSQSVSINASVAPNPTAIITGGTGPDSTVIVGTPVILSANSNFEYEWFPEDDLSCTSCQSTTALPNETTEYFLVVTNEFGCTDTATVIVGIEQLCLGAFLPTNFSPNGDGRNDTFCVLGDCIESMSFNVFNRWGELVFQSSDPENCWDGTYKGKEVNSGVFVYTLKANLTNGEVVERSGNVTLVR